MGNPKDKESDSGITEGTEILGEGVESACNAHQAACDLSQEREARDATLARQVVEAIVRRWPRFMHTTRHYSMREMQLQCQPALR